MGSVFQRDGIWYYRYEGPPKPDGSRAQIMRSTGTRGREGQRLAKQLLRDAETAVARGEAAVSSSVTVREYVEQWLLQIRGTIEETTWHTYRDTARKHIAGQLGGIRLEKLTALQIQQAYTRLRDSGLAGKTVLNVHNLLHRMLKQAASWNLRATNPADQVEPPKRLRAETRYPDRDHARAILHALQGKPWYLAVVLALATGMRRSEVCALQWGDVDFARNILLVRRAIVRIKDSQLIYKGVKNDKAHPVKVHRALMRLLARHQRRCTHTAPTDYVCQRPDGTHLAPGGITLAFRRAAVKLGVPATFHGLRHLQATTLLMAGVPVKVVSERLNHSSAQITNEIYGHVLPDLQDQAADIAADKLF